LLQWVLGIAGLSVGTTLVATPLIKRLACRFGVIDAGEAQRKIHDVPIPLAGGLAIALAFASATLLLAFLGGPDLRSGYDTRLLAIALGGAFMLLVGLLDDVRGLNAYKKFLLQWSIGLFVSFLGLRIEHLVLPLGIELDLGIWAIPFTCIWIVGVCNAVNLIDGMDGLASGISALAFAFLFLIGLEVGNTDVALLCLALSAASLGFLVFNFNPATIFLGDTGSLFLGYLLATLSLEVFLGAGQGVPFLVPVLLLALPIGDTAWAMGRRFLQGRPIFSPDRGHIHHRFMAFGYTQRETVLTLYLFTVLLGHLSLIALQGNSPSAIEPCILLGVAAFLVALLVIEKSRLSGLVMRVRVLGSPLAAIDFTGSLAAVFLAFLLSNGTELEQLPSFLGDLGLYLLAMLPLRLGLLWWRGHYARSLEHLRLDVLALTYAAIVLGSSMTGAVLLTFFGKALLGPGFVLLEAAAAFLLLGLARVPMAYTQARQLAERQRRGNRRSLLVVDDAASGRLLAKYLIRSEAVFRPIGLVLPEDGKVSSHGGSAIQVLGSLEDLSLLIDRYRISDVLLAVERSTPGLRSRVGRVSGRRVHCWELPPSSDQRLLPEAKPLFPQPPEPRQERLPYLEGARVLVIDTARELTLALCRELLRHQPRRIAVLAKSESSLSELRETLGEADRGTELHWVLGHTGDRRALARLFERHAPEVVYHLALYQDLMAVQEQNVCEAVLQAIKGTQNLLEVAGRAGVRKFFFIADEHEEEPRDIIEATKRVASLLVQTVGRGYPSSVFCCLDLGEALSSAQRAATTPALLSTGLARLMETILEAGARARGGERYLLVRQERWWEEVSQNSLPQVNPPDDLAVAPFREVNESVLRQGVEDLFSLASRFKREELTSRLFGFVRHLQTEQIILEKQRP